MTNDPADHTPIQRLRAPRDLWSAYETVCKRVFDQKRSEHLVNHMRETIRQHGTPEEKAMLARAEQELTDRRARMERGRPRATQGG